MSKAEQLRPGLRYFADVDDYDADMARLTRELGRKPTNWDILEELRIGAAAVALDEACAACQALPTASTGTFIPDTNVVEIIGFSMCKPCRERFDAQDGVFMDKLNAELRRRIAMERAS